MDVKARSGMKFRKLRILWSLGCGIPCLLLIVMWVRNFWWSDVAWAPLPGGWQVVIASADGQVEFGISQAQNRPDVASWAWETYTASRNSAFEVLVPQKRVIRYHVFRNRNFALVVPHWLLTTVVLLLAIVPWIPWSRRFTIRTLLIIMAIMSVALALAVTAGE
jgi:hypothetical protein